MRHSHDTVPKLSRWETLGAWLHVWTPHRDAEVPPVPWRTITIGTVLAIVVVAVAGVLAIPRIDAAKRAGAARDARALAAARAAERRRTKAEQAVHRGSAVAPRGLV